MVRPGEKERWFGATALSFGRNANQQQANVRGLVEGVPVRGARDEGAKKGLCAGREVEPAQFQLPRPMGRGETLVALN
jgi:hypothetical protein